ncbi:unnamed protein product, partial [Phaeothamnion confervicola]
TDSKSHFGGNRLLLRAPAVHASSDDNSEQEDSGASLPPLPLPFLLPYTAAAPAYGDSVEATSGSKRRAAAAATGQELTLGGQVKRPRGPDGVKEARWDDVLCCISLDGNSDEEEEEVSLVDLPMPDWVANDCSSEERGGGGEGSGSDNGSSNCS